MADLIQPGDIVRFQSQFLGRVSRVWASELATVSGQLVSIECFGEGAEWSFGPHLDALDLADIEFMAKGVPPDAPIEELGAHFAERDRSFRQSVTDAEMLHG